MSFLFAIHETTRATAFRFFAQAAAARQKGDKYNYRRYLFCAKRWLERSFVEDVRQGIQYRGRK